MKQVIIVLFLMITRIFMKRLIILLFFKSLMMYSNIVSGTYVNDSTSDQIIFVPIEKILLENNDVQIDIVGVTDRSFISNRYNFNLTKQNKYNIKSIMLGIDESEWNREILPSPPSSGDEVFITVGYDDTRYISLSMYRGPYAHFIFDSLQYELIETYYSSYRDTIGKKRTKYKFYDDGRLKRRIPINKKSGNLNYLSSIYYIYAYEQIYFNYKGIEYNLNTDLSKIPIGKITFNIDQTSLLDNNCKDNKTYECFESFVIKYNLWSEVEWFHKTSAKRVLANLSPQQLMDEVYMKDPEKAEKYLVVEVDRVSLKDFVDKIMFSKINDLLTSELYHLPDEVQNALLENSNEIEFKLPDYVVFELYLDQNLIFKLNTD